MFCLSEISWQMFVSAIVNVKSVSTVVTISDTDGDTADCREVLYEPCEQLLSCVARVRKTLVKQTDHNDQHLGHLPCLGVYALLTKLVLL